MGFITDKQTLDDLNIPGKYKAQSIFSMFNRVQTAGGERLLDDMFRNPLSDPQEINRRSSIFQYFQHKQIVFPVPAALFREAENYLETSTAGSNYALAYFSLLQKHFLKKTVRDERYDQLHAGLLVAIKFLKAFSGLLEKMEDFPYPEELMAVRSFFTDKRVEWLSGFRNTTGISFAHTVQYHYLLTHTFRTEIAKVLEAVYHIDVYITVSKVARERAFTYAHALPKKKNVLIAEGLYHPGIPEAVANQAVFSTEKNLLFLTGANMAGKSTFMKALGIAVYMAHMGFPVAAKEFMFSVCDGLYTSINVADNLHMGYSHFYAEVLRVKHVALEVAKGNNVVVIFDELFKGTNVKDAYDATLAVSKAFAEYHNCFFIISTHIIEVGAALEQTGSNINFRYMPTIMNGSTPQYTYQLTEGVTQDRQGMIIIENEGIILRLMSPNCKK